MKTYMTITIDIDTADKFKEVVGKGNVSNRIEELMKQTIAKETGNANYATKELVRLQLEQAEKEKEEAVVKATVLSYQMKDIEAAEQKAKEEALTIEAAKKEEDMKCINCHNFLGIKNHKFPKGMVCHACAMNAHAPDIARWS